MPVYLKLEICKKSEFLTLKASQLDLLIFIMNMFEVGLLDTIADICKCVASSEEVACVCVFMKPDPCMGSMRKILGNTGFCLKLELTQDVDIH